MYTIGQVSRICRVSTKTLRHYERLELLKPAWVNPENGYRHYTADQVHKMRDILFLKELGFSLAVIRRIISQGPSNRLDLQEAIAEQRARLIKTLDVVNGRLVRLAWWQENLEAREMKEVSVDIALRQLPEVQVFSQRKRVGVGPEHVAPFVRETLEKLNAQGADPAGAPIMIWHDEEFGGPDTDLEVAWPVADPRAVNRRLPATRAVTAMHVGPYDGITKVYEAVFSWINSQGLKQSGPIREVSCNDPAKTPPEKLVTEVFIPVE